MKYGRLLYEVKFPDAVTVKVDASTVSVKGKYGEITRDFSHTGVKVDQGDNAVILEVLFPTKKEKALIGTVQAHLKNAINGVQYGYRYYLKIVFSHFPIRVKQEKGTVKIENLYGGRKARFATILPKVKVKVDGDDVIVEGVDKESVGQTAANIQELTRQRGKRRQSPKTFMDGIFLFKKEYQEDPEDY